MFIQALGMYKSYIKIAIIVVIGTTCAMSAGASQVPHDWFVSGRLGWPHYHIVPFSRGETDTNQGTTYAVSLGWQGITHNTYASLAVEGGYASLGKLHTHFSPYNRRIVPGHISTDTINTTVAGFTLGLIGRIKTSDQWSFSARSGYFLSRIDQRLTANTPRKTMVRDDARSSSWYLGAGVGLAITAKFHVGIHFDEYHIKAKLHKTASRFDTGVGVTGLSIQYQL